VATVIVGIRVMVGVRVRGMVGVRVMGMWLGYCWDAKCSPHFIF
jgi:proteasome assembly chaperone (PAC2) family protein